MLVNNSLLVLSVSKTWGGEWVWCGGIDLLGQPSRPLQPVPPLCINRCAARRFPEESCYLFCKFQFRKMFSICQQCNVFVLWIKKSKLLPCCILWFSWLERSCCQVNFSLFRKGAECFMQRRWLQLHSSLFGNGSVALFHGNHHVSKGVG